MRRPSRFKKPVGLPAASAPPAFVGVLRLRAEDGVSIQATPPPSRAEDGIRTRDPHLGKVLDLVLGVSSTPLPCCSVHPVSTQSTSTPPAVERSTSDLPTIYEPFEHLAVRTDLL